MFPTTKAASLCVSTSLPSAGSEQIRLFSLGSRPVGPDQASADRLQGHNGPPDPQRLLSLQLELPGHRLPSQASQQVVSCQQGHGVSGSIGGATNVGQDHWKGEEQREVRVFPES